MLTGLALSHQELARMSLPVRTASTSILLKARPIGHGCHGSRVPTGFQAHKAPEHNDDIESWRLNKNSCLAFMLNSFFLCTTRRHASSVCEKRASSVLHYSEEIGLGWSTGKAGLPAFFLTFCLLFCKVQVKVKRKQGGLLEPRAAREATARPRMLGVLRVAGSMAPRSTLQATPL